LTVPFAMEEGPPDRTVLATIDFSRAYGSVWRLALFHKLLALGLPPCFVRWTRFFLSDRGAGDPLSWYSRLLVPNQTLYPSGLCPWPSLLHLLCWRPRQEPLPGSQCLESIRLVVGRPGLDSLAESRPKTLNLVFTASLRLMWR